MSWTYENSSGVTNTDIVRSLSGQTSSGDDVIVSDEVIAWALAQRGSNATRAAVLVCQMLAARYAAYPDAQSVGDTSLTWGDRAAAYRQTATMLRQDDAIGAGVSPYVGGISISDMRVDEQDSDRVKPAFSVGMMNNPGTDSGSTGAFTT